MPSTVRPFLSRMGPGCAHVMSMATTQHPCRCAEHHLDLDVYFDTYSIRCAEHHLDLDVYIDTYSIRCHLAVYVYVYRICVCVSYMCMCILMYMCIHFHVYARLIYL